MERCEVCCVQQDTNTEESERDSYVKKVYVAITYSSWDEF